MTKPKQWLFDNGHLSVIKQGRLSREHIALIEGAVRDGVQIDGYAVSTAMPKSEAEKSAPAVDRVAVPSQRIADVPDEHRPEDVWQAHITVEGKRVSVGMRDVCNRCNNSITYCWCPTPEASYDGRTDVPVTLTVRTTRFVRSW